MKRKTRSGLVWLLALILVISTCASTIALTSRIRYYTMIEDVKTMIPLVPEYVTLADLKAAAKTRAAREGERAGFDPINVTLCAPTTVFTVSDDNTVWGASTPVEIFRSRYENGQHNITVESSNGDKVIAPGTENSYTFKLKNTYTVPMDYTVTVKAYFTPDDAAIPVTCRLSRYDGAWVAGDSATWLDVPRFDGAKDAAVLNPQSYVAYTLDWQWPFEGNDALDTALAERAGKEDLTLTIEINTTATAVYDPDEPDEPDDPTPTPTTTPTPGVDPTPTPTTTPTPGVDPTPTPSVDPDDPDNPGVGTTLPPETGDNSNPTLWLAVAAASFFLLLIFVFWQDKEKKSTDAEASKVE